MLALKFSVAFFSSVATVAFSSATLKVAVVSDDSNTGFLDL
jgi:hypothetical protein